MKVAILLGSTRPGRQSHKIAHYLEQQLLQRGVTADLIDLAAHPLVPGQEQAGHPPLKITLQALSARLHAADALLFVTPEYHGSFSGVLKTALDHFWAEFSKKPIGVAAVSSGRMGGINASTQLQHVILSLGAYPLPLKLLLPEVQHAFDETSLLINEQVARSAERFLDEFLWLADAVYRKKKQLAIAE